MDFEFFRLGRNDQAEEDLVYGCGDEELEEADIERFSLFGFLFLIFS